MIQALASCDYERMAEAIRYLDENWDRRPNLDDVAAAVHLSKYHFQRLFSRWVGISPKRFLQFRTLERARALLREPRPLLDVATALNLSGVSRLHDLFVTIEAVTPGEYKSGGCGLQVDYGVRPSPFGPCIIGVSQRGVCTLAFCDGADERVAESLVRGRWPSATLRHNPRAAVRVAAAVFSTPASRRDSEPLPILLRGTNFQLKVWEALLRVEPGTVASYEQIAASIGLPGAVRAVGSALGANPVCYVIPCHRVVRKSGELGGYHWGVERKRAMLWRETLSRAAKESGDVRRAD